MKTKFYLNLKSWLLMMLMLIGAGGNLWAEEETITFSELSLENGTQYASIDGSSHGLNFSLAFGDGGNDGKYYTTGSAIRVYGGGHMIVTSSKNIEKIKLTFGSGDGSNTISTDLGSYSNGTWTGSATSVTFNVGGSSGHRRIASVAVTYESGSSGGEEPTEDKEVVFDFTKNSWNFPVGSSNGKTTEESFTDEKNTIKVFATTKYYFNSAGYLMLGKKDSYITLPAFTKDVEKIVVKCTNATSASVEYNIFSGDNPVSTGIKGSGEKTFSIAGNYQTAGTIYTLKITTAYNAQIEKITVFFKESSTDKTPVSLSFPESSYNATMGSDFNAPTASAEPTVTGITYSSSNEGVATVDAETGAVTLVAAGSTIITATFAGDEEYNGASASYTLNVARDPNGPGTQNNPYTVAQALEADVESGVYVKGIVSAVTEVSTQYGNVTYKISDDGETSSDQFIVFRGKNVNNQAITSDEDVQVGDVVVVYGNIAEYQGANQLAQGNYLVSLTRPEKPEAGLAYATTEITAERGGVFTAPELTNPNNLNVTYSSSNEAVATVDAETGVVTLLKAGETTITATFDGNSDYKPGSASYSLTVTVPSHTATFFVNGQQTGEGLLVAEDAAITFPATPEAIEGKTFVGWVTEAINGETDEAPAFVTSATMGTSDLKYYAVFADGDVVEINTLYKLNYDTEDALSSSTDWGSYGKAYPYTATDGGEWVVKAFKNGGMQINMKKDASIKIPECAGYITSIEITGSTEKAVGLSASDYNGSGTITYIAEGTDATTQTLDLTGKNVTTGYIVPKSGNIVLTKIVVFYTKKEGSFTNYCTTVIKPVATFNGQKYETLQAALDAAEAAEPADEDIVIDLLDDAELTIAPRSDRLAIGTATTKSITINGNDHKLTFMTTDTDWNDVSTRNDDQTKLVLNDMTIDQGGKNTGKTWNSYDINFNCAVELNNVTSNRPIAFKNDATLNTVTISDTSGDYYGIWISPRVEGQNISIDGLTLTAGRGIKVDDEYIDNPEKVTLDIANATFNTTKKAAILVKSKADTDITVGKNVNIENVAADKTNAVWVDEDYANSYGLVNVTGATMAPESSEADYAAKIVSGDKTQGYYKTFAAAVAAAEADQVVTLLKDVATYELAEGQTLKVDKNNHNIKVTVPEGYALNEDVEGNITTYSSFAGIVISTVEELKAFRDAVNGGNQFAGKTVKLAADLDLSGEENWTPIGNLVAYSGQSFDGVFDGNGHTIKNVTVVDQTPKHAVAGLFGSVVNGTIKNLTVENVNLTSSHYAGGIVAYTSNKPIIENCHVIGGTITSVPELVDNAYDNGDKVGGIMGYATAGSTINNCTVDGLTIKAYRDMGGIVGFSVGNVTNNIVKNTTIIQSDVNAYKNEEITTYDYIVGRNGGATLENNVYEELNNVLTIDGAVAKIGDKLYRKLQAAFKAAKADETVTLLKDYDAKNEAMAGGTRQFVINKSITFDGGGFTLTTKQRGIGIGNVNGDVTENIDVTIKNVTVLNTASGARCIDTRGKIGSLTLEGVTLNTQGAPSGYTQPLTIGGNQSDVANVTITNSTIQTNDNATAYYAIITFNPVNMTISNSTIKGWANVYAKGQDGSAGSAGSVFNFDKCTLKSSNAYSNTSNAFSAFTIEDNNVTINVTNSDIVITNTGDQLQSIAGYPKDNTLSGNKVTLGEGNKVKFVDNESCDFVINQSEGSEFTVTGGLFSTVVPDEFCAEGLTTVANTDEATKDEYPYAVGVKVELAQPIIFHDGGEYEGKLTVAIAGEGVKYTLNGGAEQTYSAPFTISETTTVKAWAEKDGVKSDEVEKTFTIVAKQAGAEVADGYYNIMTNDGKYVNVAGRKTVTLVEAKDAEGKAGTVIRVNADAKGVKVLRSQGVDLPGYAKKAMNYVPEIVQLAVDKLHAEGAGELLGETGLEKIMDKFNESFDYNLYLEKDGEAYRIYGRTPSMKPVVDFYAENKANVDAKLPELEEFINKAIQKVLQKTNGSGASVLVPFSLQTIWERMGSTLTNPADDEAKFYEEVLTSEANVWNFAYQTAMLYWGNLKNHPRFAEIQDKLGDYSKYIDKVENIRPNFKYYIVPSASGVDFISQGNSMITDASTAWTMEPVSKFTVNFETEQAFNIYPTTSGGETFEAKEYYTTLYTDFAYTLPKGVKAYKVTEITEKYGVAKREEITGVIPAQTPVLLVSNEGAQTTLTLTTEAGSAVTGNLLVGADALINEYQIKTPQVVSLFDMAKSILGESAYQTYLTKYEHLMLKNAGTVGNKYFFGLTADDLKGVTNLRVLTLDNAGMNPGFHDIWEKVDANKAVILTNDYNPVKLFLVGDVNRDGNISIADVTALVNIILGKATYPEDNDKYDFAAANVNNDKAITISDVTALVNIILGK